MGTELAPGRGQLVRTAVAELVDFLDSAEEERKALSLERERIDKRLVELQATD